MMDFIKQCAHNQQFGQICPAKRGQRSAESEKQELVLRFFAYYEKYEEFDQDVSKFLDDYLDKANKKFNNDHIGNLYSVFTSIVELSIKYLPHGFKRSASSKQTLRVRFEALSVGIARAQQTKINISMKSISS